MKCPAKVRAAEFAKKIRKGGLTMKCPLHVAEGYYDGKETQLIYPDCLKEECAWWYKDGARCALLDICLTLNCQEIALSDIATKMPEDLAPRG